MKGLENKDLYKIAEEIDEIINKLKNLPEEELKLVGRLKELIEEFHRIPLVKIVRFLKNSEEGKKFLLELVKDPDIYALFLKHNIVKPDKKTQVAKVIEMIKPYIRSHGGDVELVDLNEDTVFIRLKGACQGCSQISITLKEGILETIRKYVPEIKYIKLVDNLPIEGFVSSSNNLHWVKLCKISDIEENKIITFKEKNLDILLINWNKKLYAYRNSCAHQGLPLTGGQLTDKGTIICPWHGFEYHITTGECVNAPHVQLEPIPIRVEGEWVLIGV